MTAERHAPDALLAQTNLTGTLAAIDEDPDTPDGSWLTAQSNNADSICAVSFPTPTGNPTQGAGLQEFRWWARLTANGSSCAWSCFLRENGVRINGGVAIGSGTLTSTTGQVLSATWDAALLGTASGSAVEAELFVTKSGGSPSSRTAGEVGAVEWNAEYSAATPFQADLTAASFGITPQALTRLNAWRGDLSAAALGMTAQALARFSAWVGQISAPSFAFTGQPVSFSGAANFVADLTAASFSMSGQALSRFSGYVGELSSAGFSMAGQALTRLSAFGAQLSSGAFAIAGAAISYATGGSDGEHVMQQCFKDLNRMVAMRMRAFRVKK